MPRQNKIPMKTLQAILIGAILFAATGMVNQAQAYYDRYPNGYWDRDGRWQPYVIYHHHRGYWDRRNGARIFISF